MTCSSTSARICSTSSTQPFYFSRLAEQHPWERPFTVQPIFARDAAGWGGFFNTGFTRHALRIDGVPPHTARQAEALDAFLAVANRPEPRLQVELRRGDAAFFHNSMVMHARTDFEDSDDPAEKRHLLRLWLDVPVSERRVPWPVVYDVRYGNSGVTRLTRSVLQIPPEPAASEGQQAVGQREINLKNVLSLPSALCSW